MDEPTKAEGEGWAVEEFDCPVCLTHWVGVFPIPARKIECKCGHWVPTQFNIETE